MKVRTTVNLIHVERASRLLVRLQIRPEEAALTAKLGTDYARYTARVNRWPGWHRSPWARRSRCPRGTNHNFRRTP